jgi:hypothetical protein
MKWMTIDRDAHIGDPDFVDVPIDRLLSQAHAAGHADAIRSGEKARVARSELCQGSAGHDRRLRHGRRWQCGDAHPHPRPAIGRRSPPAWASCITAR